MTPFLIAALLVAGIVPAAAAQAPVESVLFTLDCAPSGPRLTLEGPQMIVGDTPLLVPMPLTGRYRVTVDEPGFERSSGHVVFRSTDRLVEVVEFDRHVRRTYALQSLVLPGLGQMQARMKARGFGFLTAATVLGIGTIAAQVDFLGEREDVRNLEGPTTGLDQDEIYARQIALSEAVRDQDNSYHTRNMFAAATAAVWGLSVIDAAFFTPGFDARAMRSDLVIVSAERNSAAKRIAHSAIYPGLGQFDSGSRLKGFFFLAGETAALGFAAYYHLNYLEENEHAEYLIERYQVESVQGDADATERTLAEYSDTLGERDDAFERRNQSLVAGAVVWGVNLLDAAFLTQPEPVKLVQGGADNSKAGRSGLVCLAEPFSPSGPRIGAQFRF